MENKELRPVPPDYILLVKEYLKEIRQTRLNTFEQEQELVNLIAQGDQFARIRLFESNRRFVIAICKKYLNRGLQFFPIVEAGNIGLIRAIDKYHSECRVKFSTYAAWWIRQAVEHAINDQTRATCNPAYFTKDVAFRDILIVGHFVGNICVICGFKGEVFSGHYRFYACPNCLNKRVKELQKDEYMIPSWIVLLEKQSEFKKTRQIMVREGHVFFYECGVCKKAIMPDNARYYLPPGVSTSKPYCIECYERERSGK